MAVKTPIRTVFDGSNNATGLAEYQSGEFIGLTHGGLGASLSIGSAGQVLKVNSGASALEFGTVEAVFNIDGMADGTGITVVDGDILAISDGGTEKKITASQLKSYIGGYDGDISTIDIDGGTDIGADLTTSDLIIVDDGAGGTNRKAALSRINTLVQTAGGFPLTALDIDGGTDIGAALVDADLLIVDDGAGGTNRKTTMARVATYIESGISGDITISSGTAAIGSGVIVNADINASAAIADSKLATISTAGKVDIGALDIDGASEMGAALVDADLFIVDDGAGGTEKSMLASRIKTYVADVTLTTAAQTNITSVGTLTALTVDDIVINGANIGHTSDADAIAIDSSGNVTLSQNLIITGDFTVNGSTTTVNSTNTTIDDNLLELNSGASSNANDSGIIIERGSTGDNAVVMWDESADQFVVGTTTATASSTGNISHTKANLQAAQITGSSGVFSSTGISNVMTVTGTDDGAGEGPDIVIKRNSASPADDDILGALVFKGENSADEAVTYGKVRARALDVTDGTEDGKLELFTMKAGSSTLAATLDSTGLFLNTGLTLTFEGGTANAHETILTVEDPDGDRTITLPNATGTVVLKDTTDTLTNKTLTAPTMTGTAVAADLDISGDVDVDGTLETDALTIGGATLAEVISDTVGAMVTSNTESGITVAYQDADNTLDFTIGTLNQNTTGSAATLTTARTIAGVSFDGSANIAIAPTDLTGVTSTAAELNFNDGVTLGTAIASKTVTTDSNKDTTGQRNLTITGELDAATLDISGDADIDGTLEADAITIGGVTLAETISDTVGAMVTSNTETGVTVTYDDSDNTLDFVIGTLNQNTTGSAATLTTARTIAGQSFDGSANIAIASTDLSNTSAIALLTASQTMTNKTLTSPQINTQIDMLARAEMRFQDASGGQYVALEAPATVSSNVTFTLPAADGDADQVIVTDGSGALSFADAGGGAGGFSASTIIVAPGAAGDFTLTKTNNAGDEESGFETGATDVFGVAIGSVFDLMEPVGAGGTTTDFGAF